MKSSIKAFFEDLFGYIIVLAIVAFIILIARQIYVAATCSNLTVKTTDDLDCVGSPGHMRCSKHEEYECQDGK